MGKKLNTIVWVHGGPGGSRAFGPGDDLPEWAEKRLIADRNPLIWAEGDEPTAEDITGAEDYDALANGEVATLRREVDRLNAQIRIQSLGYEAELVELKAELAKATGQVQATPVAEAEPPAPAPEPEPTPEPEAEPESTPEPTPEPAPAEDVPAEAPAEDATATEGDLEALTKDELKDLAAERGIEIDGRASKASLIETLQAQ